MLEPRYLSEPDLRAPSGPALLRWLLAHGADELSITVMAFHGKPARIADEFEDVLGPFERPPALRRVLTARTPGELTREVRLWSFSAASLPLLLRFLPHGLFRWPPGPDGWLEDLTVYRAGELVLGVVTHEAEGVLRLMPDEHAAVALLGIRTSPEGEWIRY